MRTRKDPGMRREAFVRAAAELFMEKGYDGVSVRDVLDAVADKSASPSVFYYYFSSKDELYRHCVSAVAEEYLGDMGKLFSDNCGGIVEWVANLTAGMRDYLIKGRSFINTGSFVPNRLFVLDMREQVTGRISLMWTESLRRLFRFPEKEAADLAAFMSGGVGEMLFSFMSGDGREGQNAEELAESVVLFCMNCAGVDRETRDAVVESVKKKN